MSAEIANLLVELDEVRDNAACREADVATEPENNEAFEELENLRMRETDLLSELKELGYE